MIKKTAAAINSETVKECGLNAGASAVGIAASDDFGFAPEGFKPSDNMEGCLSVIVLGAPFPQEAFIKTAAGYTEIRNAMCKKMDGIAKEVAKQIMHKGYKAKIIGGLGGKYVNGKHYGHISLKHAAELAGLGIIGRNYLLTSPQYGNLLWFSAVLTDVQLAPDKKAGDKICDNCSKCVEACPAKALDNPALFGNKECSRTCWKMVNRKWILNCFSCRTVCPYCFGK